MVKTANIRELQTAYHVCTDKLICLVVDEQKSSVHSIELGDEDAVKTVQTVAERLAVIYESTVCRQGTSEHTTVWSGHAHRSSGKRRQYERADVIDVRIW
jgi:hypothetical protein